MKKILLASNNKHKAEEFKAKFRSLGLEVELLIPREISANDVDIAEDGQTLEENSEKKAVGFFESFNITSLADDTGLEVDALEGRPGVLSARYSGTHGHDQENRTKILNELQNIKNRRARFRTVLCLYNGKDSLRFEGICTGQIAEQEKGNNGFGYDSIFIPDGFTKTFAELTAEEKNTISHRAKAIDNIAAFLKNHK